MRWPAKSSDNNIIENIWGCLTRDVHKEGRQYENMVGPQNTIMESLQHPDIKNINTLCNFIPFRLTSGVQNRSGMTS